MIGSKKMVGRKLSHDVCRCLDSACPVRYECLRYLTKNQTGERTPVQQTFMEQNGCGSLRQVDKGVWIDWNGGECPVEAERKVQVCFGGEQPVISWTGTGSEFIWDRSIKHSMDIVAFRVIE